MEKFFAIEGSPLSEQAAATYNASKGQLTVTVIQPGFNKSGARFYPAEVLKRDAKIFEGAKMFTDHATDRQDAERPEGSVNNWVASLTKVWAEADGVLRGTVSVIDPTFKAKLDLLAKQNLLSTMGVSIRATGEATTVSEASGKKYARVDRLVQARSVDFVTFAGAGGKVEMMESATFATEEELLLANVSDSYRRLFQSFLSLGLTPAEAAIAIRER